MDNANPVPDESIRATRPESEVERQRRLDLEADCIAEARAELDAGLYVDAADIGAWIASIGTDNELPAPPPRHLAPG